MHCQRECPKEYDRNNTMNERYRNKINRSVLFNCIHLYLLKEADNEKKILRKELPSVLGRGFHIPREYHRKVVLELQDHGIIIDSQKSWVRIKAKVFF